MSVPFSPTTLGASGTPHVLEVASGIDALYMSGHADAPDAVFERLKVAREVAMEADEAVGIEFGGVDFNLEPHGFGIYKYCLRDAFGVIGVSPSKQIPAVRIQPTSEFLHRAGVTEVVRHYRTLIERELGEVLLNASRFDLYVDSQGWSPTLNERHRFVSRAKAVAGFEDSDEFNGIAFGKRATGTVYVRIYNKTIEVNKKKDYYVEQTWNDRYDRSLPVIRTEFQIGRKGLTSFGLSSVDEVIQCAPGLWVGLSRDWLVLKQVSGDSNRSRWATAPEWEVIQNASFAGHAIGLKRMAKDHALADLDALLPGLTGFVSSVSAITGARSLAEALEDCDHLIRGYTNVKHRTFEEIVARKRGERSFTIPEGLAALERSEPSPQGAERGREVTPALAPRDTEQGAA